MLVGRKNTNRTQQKTELGVYSGKKLEFAGHSITKESAAQIPEICRGSPSSYQLSTGRHVYARKLPKAGYRTMEKDGKRAIPVVHTGQGIVPVPTSEFTGVSDRAHRRVRL